MVFARVRRFFRNTPTTTVSIAIVADSAPSPKHNKGRKETQALDNDTVMPCDLPGSPAEEDDSCHESTTAEPKNDNQNDWESTTGEPEDDKQSNGPASVQGSVDDGIPKDDSKKTHAGSGTIEHVDCSESTLPSELPLMSKLQAVLDEQSPTKFNVLRPSETHFNLSAASDRHRWGKFDGRWKLVDNRIGLPKRFNELLILQGHVADRKGHVQKLKANRRNILWGGRPVMLSSDRDELIIIDTRGVPVKYARAHSSRSSIADAADSTFVWG